MVVSMLFVCCLWIPVANMFLRAVPDDPAQDFRVLAEYPAYGTKIKDFPHKFQEYFHDNFAFRNKLIGLNGDIHYSLLKTSISDDVIIGKQGWLYYTPDIMDDFHGKIVMNNADMKKALDFFAELEKYVNLRSEGRAKFILAVCPNPQTIYPEYLPEHEKYTFGNKSRLDQHIEYFKQNNGVKILDLRPALLKAKGSSQEWIYYSNDSHWNNLGAEAAFREMVNYINELGMPVQIPRYTIDKVTPWSGDLVRMIAAKSVPKSSLHNFVFTDVSVQAHDGLSIVVFGDSYANNLMTLVKGTFARSYFEMGGVSGREIVENLNKALLAYEPDVIVYEYVERRLPLWSKLIVNKFEIGKTINFGASRNDYSADNGMYIKSGMAIENDYAWSLGSTAEMSFFFENVDNDLLFNANIDILGETQEVQLFVNGQLADSVILMKSKPEEMRLVIKKDHLLYGLNDFKFVFPQAVSPVELGINTDDRKLAVAFYSFVTGLFDAPVIDDDIFN
jgi:hypothetical protein